MERYVVMNLGYAGYESAANQQTRSWPEVNRASVNTTVSRPHHRSSYSTNAALAIEFPDILSAAQRGDEQAFDSLVSQYTRLATVAARRILRTEEAAADAVQEAMYKVYRALPKFKEGNFRSWLLRIVTNTCYDHLRRQKRRQTLSLDELIDCNETESAIGVQRTDSAENPETVALQQEKMQMLLSAIDELPLWHRTAVLLVDIHGLDYHEAATHLGVPIGTVKSRLSRARATLRDRLTADGLVPNALA